VDAGAPEFVNGGESLALVPTRYPGSDASDDGAIALARKTSWEPIGQDAYRRPGQRIIATDAARPPFSRFARSPSRAAATGAGKPGADHA